MRKRVNLFWFPKQSLLLVYLVFIPILTLVYCIKVRQSWNWEVFAISWQHCTWKWSIYLWYRTYNWSIWKIRIVIKSHSASSLQRAFVVIVFLSIHLQEIHMLLKQLFLTVKYLKIITDAQHSLHWFTIALLDALFQILQDKCIQQQQATNYLLVISKEKRSSKAKRRTSELKYARWMWNRSVWIFC